MTKKVKERQKERMCVSVSEIQKEKVGSIKKRESQERKTWIKAEERKEIEIVYLSVWCLYIHRRSWLFVF